MSVVGKGSRYAYLDVLEDLGTRVWVSLIIQMRVLTVGGVVVVDMVLEVSVESGGFSRGGASLGEAFYGLHGNFVGGWWLRRFLLTDDVGILGI